MTARRRRGRTGTVRSEDGGFALVEAAVAGGVLAIVLALFAVSVQHMVTGTRRVQSVADSATQARQALGQLSRQLSYASAVNVPVQVGQDWYLELRTDPARDGGPATCTQWRLVAATDELQVRSWDLVALVPTAWSTVARRVVNEPATQQPFTLYLADTAFTLLRVRVDLRVHHDGGPALQSEGQYTLRNSAEAPAPSPTAVCTGMGRS